MEKLLKVSLLFILLLSTARSQENGTILTTCLYLLRLSRSCNRICRFFSLDLITDQCLLFFTVQPPPSIPCDPYQSTISGNGFSLQCRVHAPKLSANLPERNFTVEWVKTDPDGGPEEIVGVASDRNGLRVENKIAPYFFDSSPSVVGSFVESSLTFDLDVARQDIPGVYWCRVLVKTEDSYSYSVAGRSNSQTVIRSSEEVGSDLPQHPPCVGSNLTFHQTDFRCVDDDEISTPLAPRGGPSPGGDGSAVLISSGALAAVAVTAGALFVILLILTIMVIYLCRVVNDRKAGDGELYLEVVNSLLSTGQLLEPL